MFMYSDYSQHLLDHVKKIHFIGCGGSGTYPLIQILHSRGFAITGSDVEETKNTEAERALGVRVAIGHDAANLGNPDLVVYSAAIHNDNPELQAAHARGIKAVERSVMLGYISRTHAQSIGVAGTHGKTTTTGMITTMLELAGRDPAAVMYWLRGCYYKLIKKMSSCEQIEQFTGFGLYDKSFIQTLRNLKDPTPFIRGIVAELGPERKEIEYTQPQRRAGKTHNNWYSLYDAAMLSFTSYTKAGMRIATFAGFLVAGLSFLVGLFYLIAKLLFWQSFRAGYAPTMIAIFFMGGIQLAFLGFLGEYVMAMNTRIMNRPLVVEEERLNFGPDDR